MTRDEGAVSNVVGAILVFALFISVLGMIQFSYVPVWTEDAEAAHMRTVGNQFAAIKSEMDRQADNRTLSTIANPVTMDPDEKSFKFNLFQTVGLPATLQLATGETPMSIASPELLLSDDGNRRLLGLNEQWQPFVSGARIDDIDSVEHFRVRVPDPANQQKNNPGDDLFFNRVTVIDADGAFAGQLEMTIVEYPSGYGFNIEIQNAAGTVIFDQVSESLHQQHEPAFFWINLLDEQYFFDAVMGVAKAPFDLLLTENSIGVEYAISYLSQGAQFGGGGVVLSNYQQNFAGGRLIFDGRNSEFVSQRYIVENGAVILEQPDGAAFLVPPEFSARLVGTTTVLNIKIPSIQGVSETITQSSTAVVRTIGLSHVTINGHAPSFTMAVTSEHGSLWEDHWRAALNEAGLDEGAGHFVITSDATSATMVVYGSDPAPTSTTYDLNINFRQASIDTRIR